MFKILIAEDEYDIRQMMAEYLRMQGYEVLEASNGQAALAIIEAQHIDLLVTDVMMPQLNGFDLTRVLRAAKSELPILMVTAKAAIDDKERGFSSGTDDYLVKPIILRELALRVQALLKRAKIASEKQIHLPNAYFDLESLTARIGEQEIAIPKKEFLLLFRLLSQPGKIFTRQQLLDEIWGYDSESSEATINVHISRLRERVATCPDFEIMTVKGLGIKAVIR